MNSIELDAYDWKLLRALQSNARLSNVALSEQVNLSPSQCSRRLQRLEQSSLIESYNTQLNRQALGFDITAFVSIRVSKKNLDAHKRLQNHVAEQDTVLECYAVAGEYDYWLKVIATSLPDLSRFLDEQLALQDVIQDVSTTVVLNKVKHNLNIPLPEES